MKVKIKKLHPNAVIPSYAKEGDAGMDFVATKVITEETYSITYGTDIAMEIPEGFVGLAFPRSSIRKYELNLSNSVGVIDSGYRGELQATFRKTHGDSSETYNVGDKIFQMVIIPHPIVELIEVDELSDSERGEGGFGSTGK
jgi:dUTP pyrophosphatase